MIEANVVQRRGGSKTGDVSAETRIRAVGSDYHRQRVPANPRAYTPLEFRIARTALLEMRWNRVQVRGGVAEWQMRAGSAGFVDQTVEQVVRAIVAFDFHDRIKRFQPFLRFGRIAVDFVFFEHR